MVRYFYTWTPLVLVATVAVLAASPYLAIVAFMIVVLGALAALAWAIVVLPYRVGRVAVHRVHAFAGSGRLAAALRAFGHAPAPAHSTVRREGVS
jgi:hypothetical protein